MFYLNVAICLRQPRVHIQISLFVQGLKCFKRGVGATYWCYLKLHNSKLYCNTVHGKNISDALRQDMEKNIPCLYPVS